MVAVFWIKWGPFVAAISRRETALQQPSLGGLKATDILVCGRKRLLPLKGRHISAMHECDPVCKCFLLCGRAPVWYDNINQVW